MHNARKRARTIGWTTWTDRMTNRPARITEAEIARAIRAAKKAGLAEVEVRGGASLRQPDESVSRFSDRCLRAPATPRSGQ
jgi:hypothetical protein